MRGALVGQKLGGDDVFGVRYIGDFWRAFSSGQVFDGDSVGFVLAQGTGGGPLQGDGAVLRAESSPTQKAFAMAKLKPADIDVAELHDAFTILEIAESEEAGFFPKGVGHKALERGETRIGGRLPINPSGGLKARGHPVGNTGVSQIVEVARQLRGEAGDYQVPKQPKRGFAVNFGGFGNNVVATVLTRGV